MDDDLWAKSKAGPTESGRPGRSGCGRLKWGGMVGGDGWMGAESGKDELDCGRGETFLTGLGVWQEGGGRLRVYLKWAGAGWV